MYDFTAVPTEDGPRVPPAGTIAVFKIVDMKQENVDTPSGAFIPKVGEKVYIKVDFANDESAFDERFYMLDWKAETSSHAPHTAMKRMHHLYHRVTGQDLGNGVTFENLKAQLIGKPIALAIGANIRETEDGTKAYSQVKYMNFARQPQEIAELSFNTKEAAENARYHSIRAQQSSSNADAATPSNPVAGMPAGTAVVPDGKF